MTGRTKYRHDRRLEKFGNLRYLVLTVTFVTGQTKYLDRQTDRKF